MSDDPLPVAVVGAGNMGANHVRVYDQLPGAELVEVVETDPDVATAMRDDYEVRVVDEVSDLERARAVTVAVPNHLHREVACACIEMGLDVLVEKPLALSVPDAKAIVDTADDAGAVLQVGHIERFNPAVEVLADILADESIIALEAHRLGPFNEHLAGESVVYDLMIHDLDVIHALVGSPLTYSRLIGAAPHKSATDHAVAQLKFRNGVIGTATASHVTHGKVRRLSVTAERAYITLDYQRQDITIQRRGVEGFTAGRYGAGHRIETITERPYVMTREPLKNELEQFLKCVITRSKPRIDGRTGVAAVALASKLVSDLSH